MMQPNLIFIMMWVQRLNKYEKQFCQGKIGILLPSVITFIAALGFFNHSRSIYCGWIFKMRQGCEFKSLNIAIINKSPQKLFLILISQFLLFYIQITKTKQSI